MKIDRRTTLAGLALGLLSSTTPVCAQAIRQLDITVPGGPGSGLDQTARGVEDALKAEGIVTNIRINNVTGGGGMIALSQFVTTKEANKTAVVVQGAGTVFFPLTNKTQVSLADVRPLVRLAGEYEVMAVRKDSDVRDFKDLMARFKANPGSVAWGGGSPGSTENIFFARLAKAAGMQPKQVNFIPHPNTGEVVISALNGQATVVGGGLQDFATQVEAGKLRIIAVASPERLSGVDAPTLKELGYDIVFANWRGVSVHKSLDDASASALADMFKKMTGTARWKKILADRGWLDLYLAEKDYQAFLAEETRIAKDIIADLGIVPK